MRLIAACKFSKSQHLRQWRAGYYFSGGASELSTNMRPYNVMLDKWGRKAWAERRRCEVSLGGVRGHAPDENF
jgi:hypothetical protein